MLDAAANGLGIALARPPLTEQKLVDGRLAPVDKRTVLNPVSYWLDRPQGRVAAGSRRTGETHRRRSGSRRRQARRRSCAPSGEAESCSSPFGQIGDRSGEVSVVD